MKYLFSTTMKDEKGMATLIAIVSLIALTAIGLLALSNTQNELQISGNERLSNVAFFAVESARGYVAGHPALYGSGNLDSDDPIHFPNDEEIKEKYPLGTDQSFNGRVQFWVANNTKRVPPRGSGFSVGKFRALTYVLEATGYGPVRDEDTFESEVRVEHGFYRIGF